MQKEKIKIEAIVSSGGQVFLRDKPPLANVLYQDRPRDYNRGRRGCFTLL